MGPRGRGKKTLRAPSKGIIPATTPLTTPSSTPVGSPAPFIDYTAVTLSPSMFSLQDSIVAVTTATSTVTSETIFEGPPPPKVLQQPDEEDEDDDEEAEDQVLAKLAAAVKSPTKRGRPATAAAAKKKRPKSADADVKSPTKRGRPADAAASVKSPTKRTQSADAAVFKSPTKTAPRGRPRTPGKSPSAKRQATSKSPAKSPAKPPVKPPVKPVTPAQTRAKTAVQPPPPPPDDTPADEDDDSVPTLTAAIIHQQTLQSDYDATTEEDTPKKNAAKSKGSKGKNQAKEDSDNTGSEVELIQDSDGQFVHKEKKKGYRKKNSRDLLGITEEQEDDLIDWYRENKQLYSKGSTTFKSGQKDRLDAEKAAELTLLVGKEITAANVYKWRSNIRTTFSKIIRPQASGAGRKKMSDRDKYILAKCEFLRASIIPKGAVEISSFTGPGGSDRLSSDSDAGMDCTPMPDLDESFPASQQQSSQEMSQQSRQPSQPQSQVFPGRKPSKKGKDTDQEMASVLTSFAGHYTSDRPRKAAPPQPAGPFCDMCPQTADRLDPEVHQLQNMCRSIFTSGKSMNRALRLRLLHRWTTTLYRWPSKIK